MNKKLFLIVALLPLLAAACTKPNLDPPINPDATVIINSKRVKVQIADTQAERDQGLSGRAGLAQNEGMLFKFTRPGRYIFWMKGMQIPLDFIWIKGSQVAEITPNVQPEPGVGADLLKTYQSWDLIDSVLEVNAGWAAKNNIRVGDPVEVLTGE
ncbi:MAG: hypothetical protein A2660_01140 [Candidatus Doudnabacteria bacterium RIFCSPHIGHO2_01_FULL_45_18]|uniref:DUF192 domain-containing protein n=1 Tax=Candidatus Doudnabacteria bacterium RIFCSPHIGHO2_01_FULL_45_18 TaxID=1817823 RepID=A0A1F5NSF8_9BACT|nr:MAG: hypothetical protein A2660_01140 [Candidatus Doudnabacteria bacterium RIFCSPHIGHO2_01_FULL_45_18]